jgi:hypothetical protein
MFHLQRHLVEKNLHTARNPISGQKISEEKLKEYKTGFKQVRNLAV